jgi:hypothetical protein
LVIKEEGWVGARRAFTRFRVKKRELSDRDCTYAFRNVGMIGIVNEPTQNADTVVTMRSSYYPGAYNVDFSTSIALTS